MSLEIDSCLAQKKVIRAYEFRRKLEGPKLWQLRALALERGGMPSTVQKILRRISYASPETVRILDIGCGRGFKNDLIVKSLVTPSAKSIMIEGCDLLEQPDPVLPSDARASFSFRRLPAENILETFGPESFDVVTGIAMHHHLGNLVDVAAQVNAVLVPGGIHLIADNFCWQGNALASALSRSWIQVYRWCEGNGFYNEATCDDVLHAQRNAGLEIVGTFRAPLFVEGIIARKISQPAHELTT
ncbi:MAG: class I SAM-dependent methyltransferase [Candidatus Peribacteraceae bacterium]|jgi:SAM-dependent methyltransferase